MKLSLPKPKGKLVPYIFGDKSRFKVIVSSRRHGKTGQALIWLIFRALNCPNPLWENWYIAPFRHRAKEIAWKRLLRMIPPQLIKRKHGSELVIELINGNTIGLKGADRPDTLVGNPVYSVVFDEYGGMKPDTYEYIRPAQSDTEGQAIFIGTPRGANHFKELYYEALAGNIQGFKAFPILKMIDSPFVKSEEIEQARQQMDPKYFRQEYEGSFESWDGLVYDTFGDDNISEDAEYTPGLETYFGMDFGWSDPSTIILMQYNRLTETWTISHEFAKSHTEPKQLAEILMGGEYAAGNDKTQLPVSIFQIQRAIAGAEMNMRRQEGGGRSMAMLLKEYGIPTSRFSIRSPSVFKSIMSVRSKVRNGNGQVKLIVHPRCTTVIKDFNNWHHKTKDNMVVGELPDESPSNHRYSHTMDAIRYVIHHVTPAERATWTIGGKKW